MVLLASLVVLIALMAGSGLYSRPGRQILLGWAVGAIQERLGVVLTVDDFSLAVRRGVLELRGLALGASEDGSSPLVTLRRARVEFRWGALRGDSIVIDSVRLEGPHVDLGAPLPEFASRKSDGAGSGGTTIEVHEILVVDGAVVGRELPESWEILGATWSARAVSLQGAFREGRLDVEHLTARLDLDSRRRPTIAAALEAALTLEMNGRLDVEDLTLVAEGLSLESRGAIDLASGAVTDLNFDLEAEPALLVPDLTAGGHVNAAGTLAVKDAALSGSLRADIARLPAELLTPALSAMKLNTLDPSGGWLDVKADLELAVALARDPARRREDSVRGQATLVWQSPSERLITATVRAAPPPDAFGIRVDAALLPDDPGRRHVSGTLTAPSWIEVADGELGATRLQVDLPDLRDAARRLGLGERDVGGWKPAGKLNASAMARGPLRSPRLDLTALWSFEDVPLIELRSKTRTGALERPLHLAFDLSLLPRSPGRRHVEGAVLLPAWNEVTQAELRDIRAILEVPDVAAAIAQIEELSGELLPGLRLDERIPDVEWLGGSILAELGLSGDVSHPLAEGFATWSPSVGESVRLAIDGCVGDSPPFLDGQVDLDIGRLDLGRFSLGKPDGAKIEGSVEGSVSVTGGPLGYTADVIARGRDLSWGDLAFEQLELSARGNEDAVEIDRIGGAFRDAERPVACRFDGRARFEPAWPPASATLELEVTDPFEGIVKAEIAATLDRGLLHVDPLTIVTTDKTATLRATLPLGSLHPELAAWFEPTDQRAIRLMFDDMELATLLALAGLEEDLPVRALLDGVLDVDPVNVLASSGTLSIVDLSFGSGDELLETNATLRLRIEEGRFILEPTSMDAAGPLIGGRTPIQISGAMELDTDWDPSDGYLELVRDLSFDFRGRADATLLKPFVAADNTAGQVFVEASARGPLDALTVEAHVQGPDASLTYHSPYPAMIGNPDIRVRFAEGKIVLERATGRLNSGNLELRGELDTKSREARFEATLDGARFRLDYGLVVVVRGDLTFDWRAGGRGRLAGDLVVDRGVLRRDVFLEGEVLRMLGDTSLARSDNPLHDKIDLDLSIATAEGVNIKNNLADAHVHWGRIEIGGTVAKPRIDGRIDIDPGGWLWVFGQTWRVEEAALEWSGGTVSDGRVVFEATSSVQDPSLKQKSKGFWYGSLGDLGPGGGGGLDFWGQQSGQSLEQATTELASYYQNRLAGALGSEFSTVLSYEPLPLLGETDSQARFTVAQQISPNVSFIASNNPREAEAQTYIVDLPGIPPGPGFRTQLFTNDQGNAGITLQQSLLLGSGSGDEDSGPRLGKTTVDVSEVVKARRLKRSTGYRKGDEFPEGAGLDVEVDVAEWMGRKGFPAASVQVEVDPAKDQRVDLHVAVDPGPYVSYEFEGAKIPRAARRDIAALYRPEEVGENASIDRVRLETERVLRGQGYLEPEVEVLVEAGEQGQVLRVHTVGGRKIEPDRPRIEGIPEEDAARIANRYVSRLSVVELAAGVESADRRLVRELAELGWPQAAVLSRDVSDDGETVTVRVEPGPRQHVGSLEIVGIDENDAQRLADSLKIAEGQPVDFGLVALSSREIEDDLRDRGHAEARVRTVVRPVKEDDPFELAVRFEVDPGPTYRLAEVRFEGLRASKRRWIERNADLEPGGTLRRDDVAEARQRLYRTGVFRRIDVTTSEEIDANGSVPERPMAEVDTTVTFELQEAQRFQLAYGGRWEDGKSLSAVVDFIDTNSLGRGHTSGVRVIYGEEQKRLRLYHMIPRIIGKKSSLELFVEGKDDIEEIAAVEGIEGWIQFTFPVAGRHQMRTYAVIEDRKVTPLDPAVPVDDLLLSPRFGWQAVFNTYDPGLDMAKRKGTFVGLDLSGSFETLGSDADSVAAFSQFKWFLPFRHFTWAQSWRIGLTKAFGTEVPFVDRLRAGGEYSVRGYPTNSLGPRDPDGVPLGGEVMLVVNQELHRRLWRSLWAVAFLDAGNVWLQPSTVDSELFKAYGVGFRYSSPIGPIRLDLGWPLDRREGDPDYRIYIGFGAVF